MKVDISSSTPAAARTTNWPGWTAALSSALFFSMAPPLTTAVILAGVNPTLALVLRLWLASGLLFVTLAVALPGHLRLERRGMLPTATAGLATGVSILFFVWALTRLDTSIAALLFALHPLAVLALLATRGERFTYRQWVRLALGLAGVYLLVGGAGGARVDWLGVVLVLLAALTASFQTVFTQWYLQPYNGLTVTLYMVLFMAVTVTGWWFVQGAPWQPPNSAAWVGIIALVIGPTYLARLGMFAAIRRLGSGQVALLVPLETLLTVVWSALFLGDRLTLPQLGGTALILASAALAVVRLRRAKVPKAPTHPV